MVHGFSSVLALKALAKSNGNIFAIAFKSEKRNSWKSDNFRKRAIKKEADTKKNAKRIKSDNFTRSNKEKDAKRIKYHDFTRNNREK